MTRRPSGTRLRASLRDLAEFKRLVARQLRDEGEHEAARTASERATETLDDLDSCPPSQPPARSAA